MRNPLLSLYLFRGLFDGSGGFAQGAVHILGADLQRVWVRALNQVLLVTRHQQYSLKTCLSLSLCLSHAKTLALLLPAEGLLT